VKFPAKVLKMLETEGIVWIGKENVDGFPEIKNG
jgi:hypothetical protein